MPVTHVAMIHKYAEWVWGKKLHHRQDAYTQKTRGKEKLYEIAAGMKILPRKSLVGPTSTAKWAVGLIS